MRKSSFYFKNELLLHNYKHQVKTMTLRKNKKRETSFIYPAKKKLSGSIVIPPSKSHTMRAIILSAFIPTTTIIHDYLSSPDTEKLLEILSSLGVIVEKNSSSGKLLIKGLNPKNQEESDKKFKLVKLLDVGNSGISLRFLTAILALNPCFGQEFDLVITGDESIQHKRTMQDLVDSLNASNKKDDLVEYLEQKNYAPLKIKQESAHIKIKSVFHLKGKDSQFVSALLIALSIRLSSLPASNQKKFTIHVSDPGEIPFVKMTLNWIKKLFPFLEVTNQLNFKKITLKLLSSSPSFPKQLDLFIPGDFSSAAFPLVAALIHKSEITLQNLDFNDDQGDKEFFFLLEKLGAKIIIHRESKEVTVKGQDSELVGGKIDLNSMIDSIPALSVLATQMTSPLKITNIEVARTKETDRIKAIGEEFSKLKIKTTSTKKSLTIYPSKGLVEKNISLESYDDHRMAMALVILISCLKSRYSISLFNIECIHKTFPFFIEKMNHLGLNFKQRTIS